MRTQVHISSQRPAVVFLFLLIAATSLITYGQWHPARVHAQTTLGGPLPGLSAGQMTHFEAGQTEFDFSWDPVHGLGPVYNNTNCNNCHAQPVSGGYSNTLRVTYFGKLNSDGSFNPLTNEGGYILQPLSVSKFIPGCSVAGEVLPSDATVVAQRLPGPLFGAGLIDSIPDATISANAGPKGMGIDGVTNMVLDYNGSLRVGRFGDKSEFASLLQASSFFFGHFIGVTNPVDLAEDCPGGNCKIPPACLKKGEPNDPNGVESIQLFDFEVFLAPNTPGLGNSNGQALFTSVGCALCHTPSYMTGPSVQIPIDFKGHLSPPIAALSNQTVGLYSDLLIHDMGPGLADQITFGMATGSQWRTTPLWGLSARTAYLHDGRANNLTTAIQEHGGEASQVVLGFNALAPADQADLIAFIDSL